MAGKTYVEIGTRDGDIFDCVAPHAEHAISIEMDPKYCKSLRQRGHTVACGQLNASSAANILPNADVYFWWIYNKYNLQIVRWIDAELKRRGRHGTLYFPLTAELLTEQDALVKQSQYLERFHSGGLDQRLFFEEKAAAHYFSPPKFHCSANGPGASWGIFSMLRGEVGVQAKRRHKGMFGTTPSSPTAGPSTPLALRTPASAYAEAQLLACGRSAYAVADARCLGSPSLELSAEYPERSPLVVADFLADFVAKEAGAATVGVISVNERNEEADVAACLSSPLQPGRLRVKAVVARRLKDASRAAGDTRVWYVRASGTRNAVVPVIRTDWAFELDIVRRLRASTASSVTLYLGLDGYSVSMGTLPNLLRALNTSSALTGSRGVGSVRLTRIGFDESTPRHRVPRAQQARLESRAAIARSYARDLVSWGQEEHRYGVWHMARVEIGG